LPIRSWSNIYSSTIESGFRLSYEACREVLGKRLAEPAPGRIQLLAGPRQVGKTTRLLEIAEQVGAQAVYATSSL
jgi:predicted AAA+ superfamily ATPase